MKVMFKRVTLTIALLCLAEAIAQAAVRYVDLNSPNPALPYTNWATAAVTLQDAVDAANSGDQILVANGVYASGVRRNNRVAVDKPLTLQSVNGPEFTVIEGGFQLRCLYLTNGASMSGFTLTKGNITGSVGGGVLCYNKSVVVSNCVIAGNRTSDLEPGFPYNGNGGGVYGGTLVNCILATNSASDFGGGANSSVLNNCLLIGNRSTSFRGGGASGSTLNNCTLIDNFAASDGGGAYNSSLNNCILTSNTAYYLYGGGASRGTLNNCTLTDNRASSGGGAYNSTLNNCTLSGNSAYAGSGGGAYGGTLNNCIVYFNTAPNGANYSGAQLNYCCSVPTPSNGVGNITNEPLFVDTNDWADLRLRSDSPCINAGINAYVTNSTDLYDNPRISGGVVDMGAYEFPFTPELNLARLILLVEDATLDSKNKQPLLATLNAALASLTRGNAIAGNYQLHAFQDKVRAQISPGDPALAEVLMETAREVISGL